LFKEKAIILHPIFQQSTTEFHAFLYCLCMVFNKFIILFSSECPSIASSYLGKPLPGSQGQHPWSSSILENSTAEKDRYFFYMSCYVKQNSPIILGTKQDILIWSAATQTLYHFHNFALQYETTLDKAHVSLKSAQSRYRRVAGRPAPISPYSVVLVFSTSLSRLRSIDFWKSYRPKRNPNLPEFN